MRDNNLIVCYSYSGNTLKIAEIIQSQVGGDILNVKVRHSYPSQYNKLLDVAKNEIRQDYAPEIIDVPINIDDYDSIFIGSPNWWNTIAPPIKSFFRHYDTSGKAIYPFCTHGGGGSGRIFAEIAKASKCTQINKGLAIYDDGGSQADKKVAEWLAEEFRQ